jgi:prepilin-type N-terminal cleavage/methylation domain-containing protein
MQKLRGFTLIEVLVAISIIGILSSIVYASFSGARESSRNKAMTVELKEVQLALETYRAQNDAYPLPCGNDTGSEIYASDSGCPGEYIDGLVPEFISGLPLSAESANENCDIEYRTDAIGSWYKLTAINCLAGIDVNSGVGPEEPLARCPSTCETTPGTGTCADSSFSTAFLESAAYYESFAVYSLGGQCK